MVLQNLKSKIKNSDLSSFLVSFFRGNVTDYAIVIDTTRKTIFISSYGNTGCQVFKWGIQNWKKMPKNQHTQRKLLNFENWTNGEPQ